VSELEVERVVRALHEGGLAVLPTDTVYGLACLASREDAARDLYLLKGREAIQPTAVVFPSVASLLATLPELDGAPAAAVRELLPGPYTLVVPNPARRYAWLSATRPDTLGVRVPVLPATTAAIVARVGGVAATSANLPGGLDPCRLDDVPARILEGVAAAVDGGALPGTPSTVVDLTGAEPVVLRAGAADPDAALARIVAPRA
jgi:L-threonylcarbamoyladenylate synthase